MNPIEFLKKNVKAELIRQGATVLNATQAADYAEQQYGKMYSGGKDPYGELLRLAGAYAMKYQTDLRFVQPKR